jgi:twitching motility protein PilT
MAQLDKIIKVMLSTGNAEIHLATGNEPQLRVEGAPPHTLINRKLATPHLRQLLGELVGESSVAQIEQTDGGEYSYSLQGREISVQILAWKNAVEARLRPAAKRAATAGAAPVARIELTKGPPKTPTLVGAQAPAAGPPKTPTNPGQQAPVPRTPTLTGAQVPAAAQRTPTLPGARAPESGQPQQRYPSTDALELDLTVETKAPKRDQYPSASELEMELDLPPSSVNKNPPAADHAPVSPAASGRAAAPAPGSANTTGAGAALAAAAQGAREAMGAPVPRDAASQNSIQTASPVTMGDPPVNNLFREMLRVGASDLHLCTGERPMIRKDGDMQRLDDKQPRLKGDAVWDLVRPILPRRNLEEFERDHDTDFAHEIPNLSRFRGNVFMDRRGVCAVFRTIPTEIVTADKLGLPPAVQNLCYLSKGLVLVTGPTGSGKSTTLSALIDLVNRTRHDHVITIEDPIEFVHTSKQCLINQREVGPHTESFKRALRAALREDPDVVMVGEMRDLETITIAMETAETGHLVFGTLHTSTAYSTIDRLIDSYPAEQQAQIRAMLSESLKGVVAQTLCRKIGGGRVPAFEILLVNSAIANQIREGKTFQIPSVMQTARKQGMVLLNDALYELVQAKKVEPREAYIKAIDKANFVNALRAGNHKLDFLQGGTTP